MLELPRRPYAAGRESSINALITNIDGALAGRDFVMSVTRDA